MSPMTRKFGLKQLKKIERKILHNIIDPKIVDGQYSYIEEKNIARKMNDLWSEREILFTILQTSIKNDDKRLTKQLYILDHRLTISE